MQGRASVGLAMMVMAVSGLAVGSAWAMTPAEKAVAEKAARLFSGQALEARQLPQGLFEITVVKEKAVFYVDKDVSFLFDGQLYDVKNQVNLTKERESALMRIDPASLDKQDAISAVTGKGSRELVVFEDPNCGYCRQLRRTLASIPDLTVHYFLIPVLGEDSVQKAQRIVCAADPAASLHAWMEKGVAPAQTEVKGGCTDSLVRNQAFAQQHRVTGTPTLFFADGSRLTGAQPAAVIQQKLAALAK